MSVDTDYSRHMSHLPNNILLTEYWRNLSIVQSVYLSESDFCNKYASLSDLVVISINIQSLNSKATEFFNFMDKLN